MANDQNGKRETGEEREKQKKELKNAVCAKMNNVQQQPKRKKK